MADASPSTPAEAPDHADAVTEHVHAEDTAAAGKPCGCGKSHKDKNAAAAPAGEQGTDPGQEVPLAAPELIEQLQDYAAHASRFETQAELDRPLFGVTVFLARTEVQTRFGPFTAFIFQDMIHKGYIIALAHGDIYAPLLYTRLHSSCVTSETLRGCDCDCVQQLEGAIQKISEVGNGIVFYLLQEGRGVGYAAKARDRMLVQAAQDQVSTFEAYALLGLKKDYRQYRNVFEICKILDIEAEWVLLTNNPDKVEAMRQHGMQVARTETLEYEPEPYNLAYLRSKADAGHILKRPLSSALQGIQTPERVVPFKPRALERARRFIYMASYFLPIRPVDDQVLLAMSDMPKVFEEKAIEHYIDGEPRLIQRYQILRNNRVFIKIDRPALQHYHEQHPEAPVTKLLTTPYWFRSHVYFDIVSGQDFVVLTHGNAQPLDRPVVRIQSESIMNRFPVTRDDNKAKYNKALLAIVRYGSGAIVLAHEDGRGAGFGAFALDRMMLEQGRSQTSRESYEKIGVDYESRDYDGLFTVLQEHLPSKQIQMVMNSPNSLVTKREYAAALDRHQFDVVNWIFLDEDRFA